MDPVEVRVKCEDGEGDVVTDGALFSDSYEAEYDELEIQKTIGKFNQRILLLNGTEDQLIVVVDVEKTYQTICDNIKQVHEETGVESPGGKPTIYTVGKPLVAIEHNPRIRVLSSLPY